MSKKQRGSTGESSADEEDPYIYYLIKFLVDNENNDENEVIDMSLKTWTTFDKEEGKHFVLFPAPPYGPKKREDLRDIYNRQETMIREIFRCNFTYWSTVFLLHN